MPSDVLNRIRRKSTSSLSSLKEQPRGRAFTVAVDAPPVPSKSKTAGYTVKTAAEPVKQSKAKEKKRGAGDSRKQEMPDAVLVRIFTFLIVAPAIPTSSHAHPAGASLPTNPAAPVTSKSDIGPGIRALGRCTLASRRFNRLASPVLYTHMTFDDGYRHDPFLNMQTGTLSSARRRIAKLLASPSSSAQPSSTGLSRKAALLAQTRILTISYHWPAWCNARPPIPCLPNLSVLRINLDAGTRDNGLHVDRKCAAKTCSMMGKLRAKTVVFHGVSLWSVKSAWEHLPAAIGLKAERMVYVISSARPPSRGVKGDDGERGVPLHISRQPMKAEQKKEMEVILIFQADWGKAFELDCDTKEPNGVDGTDKAWGWVGGLVNELADALRGKGGVKRIVLVNADSLPIPLASGQVSRGQVMAEKLHRRLATGQAVGYRTMRQYVCGDMWDGELDRDVVSMFANEREYDWSAQVEGSATIYKGPAISSTVHSKAGRGGLEVWYKEKAADGKVRGVRFG